MKIIVVAHFDSSVCIAPPALAMVDYRITISLWYVQLDIVVEEKFFLSQFPPYTVVDREFIRCAP